MNNDINDQRGDLTSYSMVEKYSIKEVNIKNKVNPLFEMKLKDNIESQFLHGTKTFADLPHDCQVEEDNCWLKKGMSQSYFRNN